MKCSNQSTQIKNLYNVVIKDDVKSINLVGNKSYVNFVTGLKKKRVLGLIL